MPEIAFPRSGPLAPADHIDDQGAQHSDVDIQLSCRTMPGQPLVPDPGAPTEVVVLRPALHESRP